MSVQKNITVQVDNLREKIKKDASRYSPTQNCAIQIQVANGWAVTGHYCGHTLQNVTLQKTSSQEAN